MALSRTEGMTPNGQRRAAIGAAQISYPSLVGSRNTGCATEFMQDLASRLVSRVQLTTTDTRCTYQRLRMPSPGLRGTRSGQKLAPVTHGEEDLLFGEEAVPCVGEAYA